MNSLKSLKHIFLALMIIVVSWVIIHIAAIVGVFVAVAYPIWWFLWPRRTICFVCRAKKEGTRCPFCQRIIHKNETIAPVNLRSAFLNSAAIFIIAFLSTVIVYGEYKLLIVLGFSSVSRSASFVTPSKGQHRVGEIFPMKIEITNDGHPINAVQADIGFDPHILSVVGVTTEGSFASIFIQKEINNQDGWVRLSGGLPNPGFSEKKGVFETILFKTIRPGLATIEFLPTSLILANADNGANILDDIPSVSYIILPDKITDAEEKEQQKLLTQNVLGETSDTIQMKFYEDRAVLGENIHKKSPEEENTSIIHIFFGEIVKFDHFIYSYLENLLNHF